MSPADKIQGGGTVLRPSYLILSYLSHKWYCTRDKSVLDAVVNKENTRETVIRAPGNIRLALEAVADAILKGEILVGKVGTGINMADLGTKSLSGTKGALFGSLVLNDLHGVYNTTTWGG